MVSKQSTCSSRHRLKYELRRMDNKTIRKAAKLKRSTLSRDLTTLFSEENRGRSRILKEYDDSDISSDYHLRRSDTIPIKIIIEVRRNRPTIAP